MIQLNHPRPKWITFDFMGLSVSGKTKVWAVHTQSVTPRGRLGEIRFMGRWRKYAFYPQTLTIFEQHCLRDIADFCETETNLHWRERKSSSNPTESSNGE